MSLQDSCDAARAHAVIFCERLEGEAAVSEVAKTRLLRAYDKSCMAKGKEEGVRTGERRNVMGRRESGSASS